MALSLPSPKVKTVPTLAFLPGLAKHSHLSPSILFKRRNSILPPVSSFSPISLAGNTLVLFKTKVSPSFKYSNISWNFLCSISPVFFS